MKYYKDDCHHYKVINKSTVITITDLGQYETSISFENYGHGRHPVMRTINYGKAKPCTESEYQTAFDKALNTIKNLK